MNSLHQTATRFFDAIDARIRGGTLDDIRTALEELFAELQRLRTAAGPGWKSLLQDVVWRHPILATIHEDPMCRRSFEKPRGYAGDAPLLDFIYRIESLEGTSPTGRVIHEFGNARPAPSAVRERREILARAIDAAAAEARRPIRVLAIAAGHLREASLSVALAGGGVEELVALDSDGKSLATARKLHDALPIRTLERSASRLMTRRRNDLGAFDLVYSAGLYDYLNANAAAALTKAMHGMLRPGGKLLLSNFDAGIVDAAFMEAFMGWELIYRDRRSVREVGGRLPPDDLAKARVYHGADGAIVYFECVRETMAVAPEAGSC